MRIEITPKEAKEMMEENTNIEILDVRTPEEFKNRHLEKATNLNFYDGHFQENITKLPRNKKYLIYCHSGGRAFKTGELMEELGFKEAFVVEGSILKQQQGR